MDDGHLGSSRIAQNTYVLDLRSWPLIFVSNSHFDIEDLHELEDDLSTLGARLTHDINEAEIVLSRVLSKKRAQFDLREKGLFTKEVQCVDKSCDRTSAPSSPLSRKRKRDQVEDSGRSRAETPSTASEDDDGSRKQAAKTPSGTWRALERGQPFLTETLSPHQGPGQTVSVVRTEWFTESKRLGNPQPLDEFLVYRGKCTERSNSIEVPASKKLAVRETTHLKVRSQQATASRSGKITPAGEILKRAKEDVPKTSPKAYDRFGRRKFGLNVPSATPSSWETGHGTSLKHAHLLQESTTEHEGDSSSDLPEPPEWVKQGIKYACQRLTPKDNLNSAFIEQLQSIKLARLLTNDEIGVRAYSTSIASLAAYTHEITSAREVLSIPGCDRKIANLFVEWANTGRLKMVDDIDSDENLTVLKTFYNVWGVGATTAREFYYDKGWGSLDDAIEYGWADLSRVQQIGVKYYDEFLDKIPRVEVEQIGRVINEHAVRVRDDRIQTMLVGGYRRGKDACGDVDIIVTHPDEQASLNLVEDIVTSLEEEDWITHTLTISLKSSERNQETLPFRSGGRGHGFDTLDKALVVWQDPAWPSKDEDLAKNPRAKNPNIHRRVDIIGTPWRTAGCAVVGWSGGTTFERDLRRYAKYVKTWKFDSSGVRDRSNGRVIDIEGYHEWKGRPAPGCRAQTLEEAERRVFEGFGLTYREPWERCTG